MTNIRENYCSESDREISLYLKEYEQENIIINGVETHIILPDKLDELENNTKFLERLMWTDKNTIKPYLKQYFIVPKENQDVKLFLGIVYLYWAKLCKWFPVQCLKTDGRYYHITFNEAWYCRNCMTDAGRIIRPCADYAILYYKCNNKFPPAADIFKKHRCLKCGEFLQDYLMLLDRK